MKESKDPSLLQGRSDREFTIFEHTPPIRQILNRADPEIDNGMPLAFVEVRCSEIDLIKRDNQSTLLRSGRSETDGFPCLVKSTEPDPMIFAQIVGIVTVIEPLTVFRKHESSDVSLRYESR